MIAYEDGYIVHKIKVGKIDNCCILCEKVEETPKMISRFEIIKHPAERIEFIILKDLKEGAYICRNCRTSISTRINAKIRKLHGITQHTDVRERMDFSLNRQPEIDFFQDMKQMELLASEMIIDKFKKLAKKTRE